MKRLMQMEQVSNYMSSMSVVAGSAQQQIAPDVSAAIAHEVNQPLAVILTSAEAALRWLTADPPNLDKTQQALERVVRNSRRAADVVRSVRDIARQTCPAVTRFDINGVIEDALDLVSLDLRCGGIAVEAKLADNLGTIEGDRVQLERLVANLIANSMDAMNSVEDRQRRLRIRTRTSKPRTVLVSVADNGTGLDPTKMDRIFDPFFTTKRDGMGLGLSLCRAIVEGHEGRLWAAPNLPHGSVFRFILPASPR